MPTAHDLLLAMGLALHLQKALVLSFLPRPWELGVVVPDESKTQGRTS